MGSTPRKLHSVTSKADILEKIAAMTLSSASIYLPKQCGASASLLSFAQSSSTMLEGVFPSRAVLGALPRVRRLEKVSGL